MVVFLERLFHLISARVRLQFAPDEPRCAEKRRRFAARRRFDGQGEGGEVQLQGFGKTFLNLDGWVSCEMTQQSPCSCSNVVSTEPACYFLERFREPRQHSGGRTIHKNWLQLS